MAYTLPTMWIDEKDAPINHKAFHALLDALKDGEWKETQYVIGYVIILSGVRPETVKRLMLEGDKAGYFARRGYAHMVGSGKGKRYSDTREIRQIKWEEE